MSGAEAQPEPDRLAGAPHPRDTPDLIGQSAAETAFLEAYNTGGLHHGWMITGPKGIGKATLAWRIAKFLLATPEDEAGLFGAPEPPATLSVDTEHPVVRRIQAGSESGLFALRRPYDDKTNRLRKEITVDEVRKLKNFFSLSTADGGRRVVIVDAADDLNMNAANALLKLLEEPPEKTTLLLIAHQPSALLPTIRSRCRELRCATLSADDLGTALAATGVEGEYNPLALASLTSGSVGEAFRMISMDGLSLYAQLIDLFKDLPNFDRTAALRLADSATGRAAEERFDLVLWLLDLFLARLARTGVVGPPSTEAAKGEQALFTRLSPSPHQARKWATLHQGLGAEGRHGKAVNLDPAALVFDMVAKISETAAR